MPLRWKEDSGDRSRIEKALVGASGSAAVDAGGEEHTGSTVQESVSVRPALK